MFKIGDQVIRTNFTNDVGKHLKETYGENYVYTIFDISSGGWLKFRGDDNVYHYGFFKYIDLDIFGELGD